MDALLSLEGHILTIMDKLGPIREHLIQKDDHWESWDLQELVTNLGRYVDRNPLTTKPGVGSKNQQTQNHSDRRDRRHDQGEHDSGRDRRHESSMMGKTSDKPTPKCVFCTNKHYSDKCQKVFNKSSTNRSCASTMHPAIIRCRSANPK